MALVARLATAHIDTSTGMFAPPISGDAIAGEALDAVAPCYLHTDGKYYMCNGALADNKAVVAGWTPKAYPINGVIDLIQGIGVRASYGSGLTPGAKLYLAATKGRLDTAPTTGDAVGVAQVMHDGGGIRLTRII